MLSRLLLLHACMPGLRALQKLELEVRPNTARPHLQIHLKMGLWMYIIR